MRAKLIASFVVLLAHFNVGGAVYAQSTEFQLTRSFLELTRQAVHLSLLVYDKDPLTTQPLPTGIANVQVFTDEPDQALVVSTTDQRYCFAVFRGTDTSSREDVRQNSLPGMQDVCQNATGSAATACCQVKRGFNEGYVTLYQSQLEAALRQCVANSSSAEVCPDGEDTCRPTVVLTGHSQGGSIALAASFYLPDLSPTVITFGQPKTIAPDCTLIPSDRVYRFENSRLPPRQRLGRSPVYDPIPHFLDRDTRHYGHQILLGDDATAVAYLGLDADVPFFRWDIRDNFPTHRTGLANDTNGAGYIPRVEALVATYAVTDPSGGSVSDNVTSTEFSIPTGFRNGSPCTKDVECSSQQCSFFRRRCVSGSLWDRMF